MRLIDIAGQKFGKLSVIKMLPGSMVLVKCDCGSPAFETESYSVRKGLSTACGCRVKEGMHRTHGESVAGSWTPEYRAWVNMNTRCYNPKATRFYNWGGRGISVFPAWRDNYQSFLDHVGRRPSSRHSLDRYPNPDGNYEPGNVRWATRRQQALNRSRRFTQNGN